MIFISKQMNDINVNSMNKFAAENNTTLQDYEECFFTGESYWFKSDGQRIYKMQLGNGKIYYLRTGFYNEFLEWRE
jgi:predicted AAA+ superfamily ATPase